MPQWTGGAWACWAFEMLCGYTPFHAESAEAIYDRIVERDISWPAGAVHTALSKSMPTTSSTACSAWTRAKRLGSGGMRDIEQHPFFAGVQWDVLTQQKAVSGPTIDQIAFAPERGSAGPRSTTVDVALSIRLAVCEPLTQSKAAGRTDQLRRVLCRRR